MSLLFCLLAGVLAGVFGWFAAGYQHLLYRQAEFRSRPATGRRLLFHRAFLAAACGAVAALALRPGHYAAWPATLTAVFGAVLAVLSSTDLERRIIPNRLTYPAIAAAAAFSWAWPDRSPEAIWVGAGVAALAGLALFGFGMLVGGAGAFGLGDAKLIALIGLLVGWPGVMLALFLGVLAAGIPSAVMILRGRGRQVFSYGPYLALGAVVALLWPGRFL
jgi:prepilin signal peptidase PulO-like enzyme (type II secretory pathway)